MNYRSRFFQNNLTKIRCRFVCVHSFFLKMSTKKNTFAIYLIKYFKNKLIQKILFIYANKRVTKATIVGAIIELEDEFELEKSKVKLVSCAPLKS